MLHNSSHWLGNCCGPFMALAHSLEKSASIFYTQNLHFLWKFSFTTTHIAAPSELTGMTETSGPSDEEKDWMKMALNSTRKQKPNDTTGNYCYLTGYISLLKRQGSHFHWRKEALAVLWIQEIFCIFHVSFHTRFKWNVATSHTMLEFKLELWLYFRQSLSQISYLYLISAAFCVFLIVPRSHPLR